MNSHDRQAINDLVCWYTYHIDQMNIDKWAILFAEDACFDGVEFENGIHSGRDAIRAYADTLKQDLISSLHIVSNHIVFEPVADVVRGLAIANVQALSKSYGSLRFFTRYEDEYVLEQTQWRIKKRVLKRCFPSERTNLFPAS